MVGDAPDYHRSKSTVRSTWRHAAASKKSAQRPKIIYEGRGNTDEMGPLMPTSTTFSTTFARIIGSRLPMLALFIVVALGISYYEHGNLSHLTPRNFLFPGVAWIMLIGISFLLSARSITFEGKTVTVKKRFSTRQAKLAEFSNAKVGTQVIIATPKDGSLISIPRGGFSEQDWETIIKKLKRG
jgi:hypothetical protein